MINEDRGVLGSNHKDLILFSFNSKELIKIHNLGKQKINSRLPLQ